jgi:regulator of extracellular matrix RemA (YlzA/DUF370 family)
MLKLMNASLGNMISIDKVVAIISPTSAPAKRLKDEAREAGRLVDITKGRPTRSFILTVDNRVFLSAVQVETLVARFQHEAGRPVELTDLGTD